jgi:hypothetical protein
MTFGSPAGHVGDAAASDPNLGKITTDIVGGEEPPAGQPDRKMTTRYLLIEHDRRFRRPTAPLAGGRPICQIEVTPNPQAVHSHRRANP